MQGVMRMSEVAFIDNKGYGGAGGRKHLLHVYREKTQIENPKPPKFYGDKEFFDRLIDRNITPPLKRNAKRDYFEFVIYAQTEREIQQVRKLIAERLKIDERRVLAVLHEDEGTPHTHFLIAWRDPDTRKSLRMSAGDIDYIRREGARIIGREMIPRRKRKKEEVEETKGVKYMWVDKKLCMAISRMDRKIKEKEKEAYTQIKRIVDMYGVIDVYLLRRGVGRIKCCSLFIHDDILKIAVYDKDGNFSHFDNFKYSVLRYANIRKHNEITFAPSKSAIVYKGEAHLPRAVAFIDDLPEVLLPKLPTSSLVVETSPHSYQAHIPMHQYWWRINAENIENLEDGVYPTYVEFKKFQYFHYSYRSVSVEQLFRATVAYYRGDRGCRDYYHLRKLPGFLNMKYEDAPEVKIVEYTPENMILIPHILFTRLGENIHNHNQEDIKGRAYQLPENIKESEWKEWIDFYNTAPRKPNGDVDLSVVDMKYAVYLLAHGIKPKNVIKALRQESWDIETRKAGHLNDYLNRTVNKAYGYALKKELVKADDFVMMREIENIKDTVASL